MGLQVALPVESASGQCFLESYIKHILALGVRMHAWLQWWLTGIWCFGIACLMVGLVD